jgi:hypothetical protein
VIYTAAFRGYLERLHFEQSPDYPGHVLTMEYVRCAAGAQKGRAWWQTHWVPERAAPEYRCFELGKVRVHIPKAAQHGLKERCLDFEDGRVVVRP